MDCKLALVLVVALGAVAAAAIDVAPIFCNFPCKRHAQCIVAPTRDESACMCYARCTNELAPVCGEDGISYE